MALNVLYTCDDSYVWQMGISLCSLFENNRGADEINVFHIGTDISQSNREKLLSLAASYGRSIVFYDMDGVSMSPVIRENGRWPRICYARLYAFEVLHVERVLYLDCDTVILGDLSALFTEDYAEKAIYGAKDYVGSNYKRLIGMPVDAACINGGVILLNLDKYRALDPRGRIDAFLDKYGSYISYADQDVINGAFWQEFGFLDAAYDVMSIMKCFSYREIMQLKRPRAGYTEEEVNAALEQPKILHFTGNYRFTRPWIEGSNHPYLDVFLHYKAMSPWRDREPVRGGQNMKEIRIANRIRRLPGWFSCNVLGLLYCQLRPASIWLRGRRKKRSGKS